MKHTLKNWENYLLVGTEQLVDSYLYEARVKHKWSELERAIAIAGEKNLEFDLQKNYVNELKIFGWCTSKFQLNQKVKWIAKHKDVKIKKEYVFRKDLEINLGKGYSASGYCLYVDVSKIENKIDIEILKKDISTYLNFKIRRQFPLCCSEIRGHVDEIVPSGTNGDKEFNWINYFIYSPYNAVYLLEIMNDHISAKNILRYFNDFELEQVYPDKDIRNFVQFKLKLISGDLTVTNDFKIFSIDKETSVLFNANRTKSPVFIAIKNDRSSISFIKSEEISTPFLHPNVFNYENVIARPSGRVLRETELLTTEFSDLPYLDFVSGRFTEEIGSMTNLNSVYSRSINLSDELEQAVYFVTRSDGNWFHWLIETLPKIYLLQEKINEEIPFIVSDRINNAALESLKVFVKNPIYRMSKDTDIKVRRLTVPGAVIYHPDTSDIPWNRRSYVNKDALTFVRNQVFECFNVKPERVSNYFVVRNSTYRKLVNQRKIENELKKKFNFELVDFTNLNFSEQVELASKANLIVYPGGASMANHIFLPEGAQVITLTSHELYDFTMPAVIGSISNSSTYAVTGPSLPSRIQPATFQHLSHSDFEISLDVLEKKIIELIKNNE